MADDECASLLVCPQALCLAICVAANDLRRSVENDLSRSIIAFETNDFCFRKVCFKIEDIPQIGATPFVDGLVGVSDNADVSVCGSQVSNQSVLRPVRVLVFINHYEAEALAVSSPSIS